MKSVKRKAALFIALLLLGISVFSVCGEAMLITPTFDTDANALYLYNVDSESAVVQKNIDAEFSPGGFVKIVTALVALQKTSDLSVYITAGYDAFNDIYGVNCTTAGLRYGETLSLGDLLICMLLQSANDAANMIASYFGDGDISAFVADMNTYVTELGCTNTVFTSPHGVFEDGQKTTVTDLMLICRDAIQSSVYMELSSLPRYTVPETNLGLTHTVVSTNRMLDSSKTEYYYQYARGIKTASITDNGSDIAVYAEKGGFSYICIIAGAVNYDYDKDGIIDNMAMLGAKKLFEWAFDSLTYKAVASPSTPVCEITVEASWDGDYVLLVPENELCMLVPKAITDDGVLIKPIVGTLKEYDVAPVKKGDVLGQAEVVIAGEPVGTVNLVASRDMNRSIVLYTLYVLHVIAGTIWFKIFLGLLILLVIAYVVLTIRVNSKRSRKKNRRTQTHSAGYDNMRSLKISPGVRSAAGSSRGKSNRKR